ncbi:MAG: hypothetical protein IKA51_02805 [Clostridia bacterium]|nr:hypothetical protein [Clostridia bacterium]
MAKIKVATPSRICLFGEHQDYLNLEVIAAAIDLRFYAEITENGTDKINIKIRESSIDFLGAENTENKYDYFSINFAKPIVYSGRTDFLRSAVNVLKKKGYPLKGCDIKMDSEIPIGKGMCSSSTMIVVLIKALLELMDSPDKNDAAKIALLAYEAEVKEFGNPGGMMDQVASALGGLLNIDFSNGGFSYKSMNATLTGDFILFDSLEQKNTIKVLADAKAPTIAGLKELAPFGISSIRDLVSNPDTDELLKKITPSLVSKVRANIDNHRILLEAKAMMESGNIDNLRFGELLYAHHCNLRDGLGASTDKIDTILNTALENGALGGKVNGSGGGGCLYVYCEKDKTEGIMAAVEKLGYPSKKLSVSNGVCRLK